MMPEEKDTDTPAKKLARILKAIPLLQAKVGKGEISERKIKKSQRIIDENDVDFAPLALEFLEQLEAGIKAAKKGGDDVAKLIAGMSAPVMQLKGNAGMFGYSLIGRLANIMLNFLETIETIDDDVIEIAEAHHKTIHLIITNKMAGPGGDYGQELQTELKEACRRYFAKKDITAKNPDAFFID